MKSVYSTTTAYANSPMLTMVDRDTVLSGAHHHHDAYLLPQETKETSCTKESEAKDKYEIANQRSSVRGREKCWSKDGKTDGQTDEQEEATTLRGEQEQEGREQEEERKWREGTEAELVEKYGL